MLEDAVKPGRENLRMKSGWVGVGMGETQGGGMGETQGGGLVASDMKLGQKEQSELLMSLIGRSEGNCLWG